MAGNLSVAREKLAERILEEFKGKITGAADEPVVGDNPENKFFVGKLLTKDSDGNSGYSSDVFIESVGADFYVAQSDIKNAEVKVSPRGEFYYRCYPTLEQQRAAMLEEANDYSPEPFESFEALAKAYAENPEKFKRLKIKLIPVYKKKSIASPNFFVYFKPGKLLDESGTYGLLDERSNENLQLMDQLNALKESLNEDEDRYTYVVHEKTKVSDLYSEEAFKLFIARNSKRDVIIDQNWSIYINVTIKKIKDRFLVSVALVNDSKVQSNEKTHQSNKHDKDKPSIETLFNSGIDISLSNAEYAPIELDYFLDDYKYDKEQKAVGLNCSVKYSPEGNTIFTDHLPTFVQKRLVTNDELAVKFQDLIDQPLTTLKNIRKKMDAEIKKWHDYYTAKAPTLTEKGKEAMHEEIGNFQLEIDRFQLGVDTIEKYPSVLKSFVLMNKAFKQTAKKYDTWRLFQIVFIVSLVPDIVACDENIMPPEDKDKTTLSEVSLLYFPTGGGKTEAFLGVLVFNLFFDRFRGKSCGVTSILRYPLRLLSVQQVQRLANTLAQAELLRRSDPLIKDTDEFSLGYFVGDNNTPNNIKRERALRYRDMRQEELDEERILDICPFCGKQTVHLKFNEESYRLMHFCDNPDCPSGDALPVYMVDYEIYRYLPSAIISTVDKLAIVGNNPSFRNILAGAPMRCPRHGYTSTRKCLVAQVSSEFCDEEVQNFEEVSMYIGDNNYSIERFMEIKNLEHKKLFIHYFTMPTLLKALSMDNAEEKAIIVDYITKDFPLVYKRMVRYVADGRLPHSMLEGAFTTFKADFAKSVLEVIDYEAEEEPFVIGNLLKAQKRVGRDYFQFDLIRTYYLFKNTGALRKSDKIEVVEAIKELDEGKTRSVLASRFKAFRAKLIKQATNDALGAQYVAAQIDQQLNNLCKQISLFEVVE